MVQHRSESGGAVEANKSDRGGQIFIFNLELPSESLTGSVENPEKAGQLTSRWPLLDSSVGLFPTEEFLRSPRGAAEAAPHSKQLVGIF